MDTMYAVRAGASSRFLPWNSLMKKLAMAFGGAGILHAHSQNSAQHDGNTHAAESAAEAAGDRRQNIRKSEALRLKTAKNQTHEQRGDEQRKGRMQFDFHDQYHQYRDGNDQQNQKSSCRHIFNSLA